MVFENGRQRYIIRLLSGSQRADFKPPKHRDTTQEMLLGYHTSSRTMVCFESNYTLLRVESRSTSSRTTLSEACAACTYAPVRWHVMYGIGLPEDWIARRTVHIARLPPYAHQVVRPLANQHSRGGEGYLVLPVQVAREAGVGSNDFHGVPN